MAGFCSMKGISRAKNNNDTACFNSWAPLDSSCQRPTEAIKVFMAQGATAGSMGSTQRVSGPNSCAAHCTQCSKLWQYMGPFQTHCQRTAQGREVLRFTVGIITSQIAPNVSDTYYWFGCRPLNPLPEKELPAVSKSGLLPPTLPPVLGQPFTEAPPSALPQPSMVVEAAITQSPRSSAASTCNYWRPVPKTAKLQVINNVAMLTWSVILPKTSSCSCNFTFHSVYVEARAIPGSCPLGR
jgi:hypothetical protein